MNSQAPNYHGYRFPPVIISHAVWLYHRFCLSFRDAEDLLAQRGITVSYEAIRQGTVKLRRIGADDPFDVGLPLFISSYLSRRSTQGRSGFLTDDGEQPVAGGAPRKKDSEQVRARTRIAARAWRT